MIEIAFGEAAVGFTADRRGWLRQQAFGPRAGKRADPGPPEALPLAYPAWGQDVSADPALRLGSHDGTQTCYPALAGYQVAGGVHRIRLEDAQAALTVDLCARVHPGEGVLAQWAEISHGQPGPVRIEAAAAAPVIAAPEPLLTRYDPAWGAEWTASTGAVPPGGTQICSRAAIRPCLQASPFFLLAPGGPAGEETGSVLAGSLAWGGGVRLSFDRPFAAGSVRVRCAHEPAGYLLEPGEVFVTPAMIWAWSAAGTRPLTHRLHRWVRAHATRDGDRVRPLVFNTWEATCFDFDQASLEQLMAGAAGLGAELFLLDDGWFGTEHPRTSDTRGLGDWAAAPGRLPGGLPALTAAAKRAGLRFGLWVEPEMVSPQSVLYREHPDWVVAEAGRERREERSQLVLDLCRPEVAGFVTGTLSTLLAGAPGISYFKWDANRDISEPGSGALPAAAQQNLWADTVRARWQVMAQVAEQWPGTELMACASGGGRADLGTLRWFHETWLSDNTDAGARLAMQWHASVFLPPQLLAAHVTRRGGQDVAFACAVAMSARFGFDLDPAALTGAELAACRRAAVIYRQVRDLVQLGDLFRLIAPDAPGSDGRVALGYAGAGAGQRAVIFGYQLGEPGAGGPDPGPCPVPMAAAGQPYRVRQLSLTSDEEVVTGRDGASLLADGLAWPLSAGRTAALWLLEPA